MIEPAEDELEPTDGRERYIFVSPRRLSPTPRNPLYRVNDQAAAIQVVMCAMHNLKTAADWKGLAFFDSINDLRQFQHNYEARSQLEVAGRLSIRGVGRFRRRTTMSCGASAPTAASPAPTDRPRTTATAPVRSRAQNASLGECPHFRAGDCWVFAKLTGWNQRLRVASSVYAGAEPQAAALDNRDLIPTSPSLEVGYDDDAIHLIYQHKAPPSATSFIQRRGRAGRDPNDSPVIVTLLWPYRRDDAFYFFHPEALYEPAFDDLPLNAGNFNVQRTHVLLAFFDLLACLRRQNVDGIRDDARIMDFTRAGWHDFTPGDELIQNFTWLPDPKRPGQQRVVIKHRLTKEQTWVSGGPVERGWVQMTGGQLTLKGWLAMEKDLTHYVLRTAWDRLSQNGLFERYLASAEIASRPFRAHRSYPFLVPPGASLPDRLLRHFGDKEWHSSNDSIERDNWLKTYRHIDWMLQGSEEATTLIVHYPNPDLDRPGHEEEPARSVRPMLPLA